MFSRFARAVLATTPTVAGILLPVASHAQAPALPLYCPVMGKPLLTVQQAYTSRDVKGIRYYLCCEPCEKSFDQERFKFTVVSADKPGAGGVFLFDPVSTKRLELAKAVSYSVYAGTLYPFASPRDKVAFDKDPKRFALRPEKELLYCPVSDKTVKDYAAASDYSDYRGERIYFCCPGCKGPFDRDPQKYEARMQKYREHASEGTPAPTP